MQKEDIKAAIGLAVVSVLVFLLGLTVLLMGSPNEPLANLTLDPEPESAVSKALIGLGVFMITIGVGLFAHTVVVTAINCEAEKRRHNRY